MWEGIVWACIVIFVWLRDKIRREEWWCEVVGSCEVQQVVKCSFPLPHNLIKPVCVCMCVLFAGSGTSEDVRWSAEICSIWSADVEVTRNTAVQSSCQGSVLLTNLNDVLDGDIRYRSFSSVVVS